MNISLIRKIISEFLLERRYVISLVQNRNKKMTRSYFCTKAQLQEIKSSLENETEYNLILHSILYNLYRIRIIQKHVWVIIRCSLLWISKCILHRSFSKIYQWDNSFLFALIYAYLGCLLLSFMELSCCWQK